MFKNWKLQEILSALLLIVGGIILLFRPEMALVTIANVIGAIVIIIGVVFIIGYFFGKQVAQVSYDLVKGIVAVAIGLFICLQSEIVVSILPVILGIGVVLSGIMKIQHAMDLRRMGVGSWIRIAVVALVSVFLGLLVILNPFSTMAWLVRFIGIDFIYSGVTDLITTLYVSKKMSDYYVDGKAEEQQI